MSGNQATDAKQAPGLTSKEWSIVVNAGTIVAITGIGTFMWQVIEPLMLTLGVMISWSFIYGERNHGVRVIPLVLTGYALLTVWRHMVARLTHAFRHGSGLLFHRHVRPADILVARGLLEAIGTLIAFFVAYIPLMLLDVIEPVDDYLVLLGAWTLMSLFTFCAALIITVVLHYTTTGPLA